MIAYRQRGSVALMLGLALPVLIAILSLGTEITYLLYKQRQMQAAADASALGGASALQSGHPLLGVEARAVAAYLGFVDGAADGTTVVVNNPPQSGVQQGRSSAVEVLIAQTQTLTLVRLFYAGPFNVTARAVAIIGSGSYCVLQLGGAGNVNISNGGSVNPASGLKTSQPNVPDP